MGEPDVRQLRYFVAVAEELHFGRAASRLGIAQPPLSRAIRELERQLGARLLERTTRQVTLTPAGEGFLRDARSALDAVTAAAQRARNAGRDTPTLRVAFKADCDGGLLPGIRTTYERDDAALPVELLMGGLGQQVPALLDGRADVALLLTPFDDRGLDSEPLLTEPRLVALPADDPLAARDSLRLADLAGRALPDGTPAEQGPSAGPGDRTRTNHLDLTQIFSLVELGDMVLFSPTSLAHRYPRTGIAYRTVTDLGPSTLSVAWPSDSRSHAVAAFVRAATTVAASASPDGGTPVAGPVSPGC
ncbi:LysR family transcriptional regulator [Actinopolyspora halophila]|uniref:LysR family transcriptional regulator n=1 Tax=Actinopolyspora halophila TaxID=1850 RepID=UPI00036284A0|nr:LysR family transcriptional regulator [Actinopolyspora halophila]